uniref:Uncharacterized protein n=1 Tax=Sphaerodactylus townsendi TaxID=933632 RepID=A0ACB8ERI5_9SAUR
MKIEAEDHVASLKMSMILTAEQKAAETDWENEKLCSEIEDTSIDRSPSTKCVNGEGIRRQGEAEHLLLLYELTEEDEAAHIMGDKEDCLDCLGTFLLCGSEEAELLKQSW